MKWTVWAGFAQIFKVQGLTVATIFLLAPAAMGWMNISYNYITLLYVDIVAVALQVMVLSILNVLFYLDRLTAAFWLTFMLLISNGGLTWISLQMDPVFYGCGFCGAMLTTALLGLVILRRTFQKLEYHTFMLQI